MLVALWIHDLYDGDFWPAYLTAVGAMLLISFVLLLVINALQTWQRKATGAS